MWETPHNLTFLVGVVALVGIIAGTLGSSWDGKSLCRTAMTAASAKPSTTSVNFSIWLRFERRPEPSTLAEKVRAA
jgi:hypothetical protein